ncbi:hypothetical protein COLU111180_18595 [Cohnella lubricantis]|uniref:Uncharacterized protein n=1 Tax=Cohnella lubricantis TaxID=2163172 RepID=A0A841T8P4_9BACL|nr:hypothetical protein [Cohnella lubricantis]MBB6675798.1 hypothetical protein [Cohnella lubricantis]MBP2119873.1 uncharacterized protein with PIN domain [Cohnella lubricantis]
MSIRHLNGVILVPSPINACLSCRGAVIPRKLEAHYVASPHHNNGTFANLLTDVWYCQRCDKGFVLSAFKQVTDSFNRTWIIKELTAQTQSHGKNKTHMGQPARTSPKPQSADVAELRVKALDYILQDHENKCPKCKRVLIKSNVQIQIVKGEHVDYTPCSALHCELCQKWMIRKHHYVAMQTNLQPYIISLSSTAKHYNNNTSKRNSVNSRGGNARSKMPSKWGVPPSKRVDPGNRLFNQYGVFLPSPTGRRGDFNE